MIPIGFMIFGAFVLALLTLVAVLLRRARRHAEAARQADLARSFQRARGGQR